MEEDESDRDSGSSVLGEMIMMILMILSSWTKLDKMIICKVYKADRKRGELVITDYLCNTG